MSRRAIVTMLVVGAFLGGFVVMIPFCEPGQLAKPAMVGVFGALFAYVLLRRLRLHEEPKQVLPADVTDDEVSRSVWQEQPAREESDASNESAPSAPDEEEKPARPLEAYERVFAYIERHGPPKGASTLALLVLSALFLYNEMKSGASTTRIAIFVGVLLFHELGHWIGMRWFGYRDVKMFFIPFMGAAVTGRSDGAPRWQEGVILLLGPLPGLLGGVGLIMSHPVDGDVRYLGVMLVFINALNLLPFSPLDGGRLVQMVLFSRSRALELPFVICAGVGLVVVGVMLKSPTLAIFGALGAFAGHRGVLVARRADEIRARHGVLPALTETSSEMRRDLYAAARDSIEHRRQKTMANYAAAIHDLHDLARAEPVSVVGGATLLAVYLMGAGVAVFGVLLIVGAG